MQLIDPTSSGPERPLARAAPLASLDGKKIAIVENAKLNAPEMLQRDRGPVRRAARLHPAAELRTKAERQRARAVGDAGGGGRRGGLPDHRPG